MQFNTKSMNLVVRPDDIVELTIPESWKGPDTLETAKESVALIQKAIDGKPRGLLSHMPSNYMSKEVMDYYNTIEMGEIASAMIATSFASKVLGNFFIKLLGGTNRKVPLKLFSKQEDAEKWLLEIIAQHKTPAK